MDKKSPEQQKPESVDAKQTDAFGNKGVVMTMRHVPDDELPVDAEGNRAEILGPGTSNPLGIESIIEREAELFKDYVNETLTDEQKLALSALGEVIGGHPDNHQTGVMTLTISVPVNAGKTSRAEALRKLLEETPAGSITGYWKYPVQE